jgi:hypothetical protein
MNSRNSPRGDRLTRFLLATATLVMTIGGSAFGAASLTATFNNVSPVTNVQVTISNPYYSTVSPKTETVPAGQLKWTGTSANNPNSQQGTFTTFCIDFDQNINYGSNQTMAIEAVEVAPRPNAPGTGNPSGGSGSNLGLGTSRSQATLIRQLFTAFYYTLGTDADRSAAFQLSLWKILYESDTTAATDITRGSFKLSGSSASSSVAPVTNTFLSYLVQNPSIAQDNNVYALTSSTIQDQVTVITPPSLSVIPEPTSLGLLIPAASLTLRRR